MSKIENTSELDIEACEETVVVTSNTVDIDVLDLTVVKTASCGFAVQGGTVTFCTTIQNSSKTEIKDAVFHDALNSRLTYVANSFIVNGTHHTPTIKGQTIEYKLTLPKNSKTTICFKVKIGPEKE